MPLTPSKTRGPILHDSSLALTYPRRIRELEDSGLFELAPEDVDSVNASRLAAAGWSGSTGPRRPSYDARTSEHSGTPATTTTTTRERTYSSSNPVLV